MKKFKTYFFEDEEEFKDWSSYISKLILFLIIGIILMLIIKEVVLWMYKKMAYQEIQKGSQYIVDLIK